mmetsp:Transcript_11455/g.20991  ORF Transcript_11455/g.20991 Transcript_11455/m.20991 type:complete len:221 (-) Transcript_11455:624-1286(-)
MLRCHRLSRCPERLSRHGRRNPRRKSPRSTLLLRKEQAVRHQSLLGLAPVPAQLSPTRSAMLFSCDSRLRRSFSPAPALATPAATSRLMLALRRVLKASATPFSCDFLPRSNKTLPAGHRRVLKNLQNVRPRPGAASKARRRVRKVRKVRRKRTRKRGSSQSRLSSIRTTSRNRRRSSSRSRSSHNHRRSQYIHRSLSLSRVQRCQNARSPQLLWRRLYA